MPAHTAGAIGKDGISRVYGVGDCGVSGPSDDRNALARAYGWATQIATIAIGMAVPPLLGHLADERWGTRILFTVLGAAFGMFYGIWHLLKLADPDRFKARRGQPPKQDGDGDQHRK